MSTWVLAFGALRRRPLRAALTLVSVAIGIGVLTIVLATFQRIILDLSAYDHSSVLATELSVVPVWRSSDMPYNFISKIGAIEGARVAYYATKVNAKDPNTGQSIAIAGNSEQWPTEVSPIWVDVPKEIIEEWKKDRTAAIATSDILPKMGWKSGQLVTLRVSSLRQDGVLKGKEELQAKILGPAKGMQTGTIYLHYEYLAERYQFRGPRLIVVQTPSKEKRAEIAQAIDEMFASSEAPTVTQIGSERVATNLRTGSAVPLLLLNVGFVIVLVTLFVTANTVAMSLRERQRELATLRAIGFRRARIVGLVLGEALVLCGMGGLVGTLGPFLLYSRVGIDLGAQNLESVLVRPEACAVAFIASLVLAVLASVVPAFNVVRQDVTKILRG